MSDLALAAAFAAGQQPAAEAYAPQRRVAAPVEPMEEEVGELPTINDLEVAAAAAGVAPVPPLLAELGYFELGPTPEAMKEDSSSSEEDSSSSDEEDSSEEEEEEGGRGRGTGPAATAIRLELQAVGEEAVAVRLVLLSLQGAGAAAAVEAEVEADSSYGSSSSSGSESGGESGDEGEDGPLDVIENYADLKKMIDDMDAAPAEPAELDDDEDGGGGGGGGGAHRAEAELLGSVPLPSLAALEIGADEPVQAAGTVQSMLEGMVVIKAQAGSRALNEGCVLVLEDRTPIGCVEEIFGPVMSPFYALRYAGAAPMPAALQTGATVYSVDRLADFVLPEALRVRGYDAGAEEEEEADLEARFSDDEAEAEHRRRLKAKRKEQPDGLQQQAGGRGGRQFSGGRGGRAGRGGGRGRGRGGQQQQRHGGQQGQQGQQQQQQAFYHPQQQMVQPVQPMQAAPLPQGGRQFSGGLRRQQQQQPGPPPPPPAAFQAHAAAAQFTGMNLQGVPPGVGVHPGYAPFYGGQPGMPPPRPSGQVLRPQYAMPPPPRAGMPGMGTAMQPQYAGAPPGAGHFAPAPPGGYAPQQQGQAVHGGFRPALQPPPPAYPPPPQLRPPQQQ